MRCSDIMQREVEKVHEGDNIHEAAKKMRDSNVGFLPVCDGEEHVIGTLTDRDIAIRVCADDLKPSETKVEDAMSAELVVCHPEDDVRTAEEMMAEHHKSRIMVVDADDKLLGVISLADIAERTEVEEAGRTFRDVSSRELYPS